MLMLPATDERPYDPRPYDSRYAREGRHDDRRRHDDRGGAPREYERGYRDHDRGYRDYDRGARYAEYRSYDDRRV